MLQDNEGVQPKQGMEAFEKQNFGRSLSFATHQLGQVELRKSPELAASILAFQSLQEARYVRICNHSCRSYQCRAIFFY